MIDTNKTLGEATKRVSEQTSITIEQYAAMVAEDYARLRLIEELESIQEELSSLSFSVHCNEVIQQRLNQLKQ